MRRLGDLAHARAGDKGESSILCIFPFEERDFGLVATALNPEAVARHFATETSRVRVSVARELGALCLVIEGRLDGGVTRSANADPHGKTLSGHLLDLRIEAS